MSYAGNADKQMTLLRSPNGIDLISGLTYTGNDYSYYEGAFLISVDNDESTLRPLVITKQLDTTLVETKYIRETEDAYGVIRKRITVKTLQFRRDVSFSNYYLRLSWIWDNLCL